MGNASRSRKRFSWKYVIAAVIVLPMVPFAPEILLIVDVAGLEVALTFILLFAHTTLLDLCTRITIGYNVSRAALANGLQSRLSARRITALSAVGSLALFCITGSLALSMYAWLPATSEVLRSLS